MAANLLEDREGGAQPEAGGAGWFALVGLDQVLFQGTFGVHVNPRVIPFRGCALKQKSNA